MKKIILLLFVAVSLTAISQNNYYYYKGEKIPLNLIENKVVIAYDTSMHNPQTIITPPGIEITSDYYSEGFRYMALETSVGSKQIINTFINECIDNRNTYIFPVYNNSYNEINASNFIYVKLINKNDIDVLKQLADKFSLVIKNQDLYMPEWFVLSVTPETPFNSVETANTLYETGLVSCSEPAFSNIVNTESSFNDMKSVAGDDYPLPDFEVDGIYYKITSNIEPLTVEVSYKDFSTNTYVGNIVIPQSVEFNGTTYSVTSIGANAFCYNDMLTSVTIPNSVTSIQNWAFGLCSNLKSITIPSSVESIEYCAFEGSGIMEIELPNSITSIEQQTFYACHNLSEITIPNSITKIGESAFSYCNNLKKVHVGAGVNEFEENIFFSSYKLAEISVDENNPKYDSRDNCNAIIETDSNKLIYGCLGTTIPTTVTEINIGSFAGTGIIETKLPSTITSIPDYAFNYCPNLANISFEGQIKSIGLGAFAGCYQLTNLTLPSTLSEISDYAFYDCQNITTITIPNSVTTLGKQAFYNCNKLTEAIIGDGITEISVDAFRNCTALINLTIGNSVERISRNSFFGCWNLVEITIPAKVSKIESEAFGVCSTINTINCEPSTPPILTNEQTFYNYDANLNVPIGCSDKYINAPEWSKFKNINEVPFATIDEINNHKKPIFNISNGNIIITDNSAIQSIELYDFSGTKIYTGNKKQIRIPNNGIFILKIDNKAYKILN